MTIALALLMLSVDSTIVATALGTLQHGLDTTINWAAWTLTAYSLGFISMLPVSGKLSERFGRRRVFVVSVAAFTLASLLCGLAGNIFTLIVLRAVQAAGGAGFTPSATGLIVEHFGNERDRAVSLFGSIFPIGAMIGPIFGGLIVTHWSWRDVFYVNVPIGLAILVLALRLIPPDRLSAEKEKNKGKDQDAGRMPDMDFAGMTWLVASLLGFMFAMSALGESLSIARAPGFLASLLAAAVCAVQFFRHIRRAPRPFIAPHLIHGAGFGTVNLVNMLYGGAAVGAMALVPLYASQRYGIDTVDSGTLLVAQGLAAMVFSFAAALALRRTGYRLPLRVGSLISVIGMLLLARAPVASVTPYVWLAGAAFLVGTGSGICNPPSRNAGLQLAPEHAPVLAALRTLSLQIGSILTISMATAVIGSAADPGRTQAVVYGAIALILLLGFPLFRRVPEYRGAW